MFSSERSDLRKIYFQAWQKHKDNLPLEALEKQIVDVVLLHPEYHNLLEQPERYQDQEFLNENPFLHLSLHIAVRDQIKANRPFGIKEIYERLSAKHQDFLIAEHKILAQLEKILWDAQENNSLPDELNYLENLNKII